MISHKLELRKIVIPEMITGIDSRLLVARYLSNFNAKKPFIVTDKGVSALPWFKDIIEVIKKDYSEYVIFDQVKPNPKDDTCMLGTELYLNHDCDVILAIGGGSPMDCAKGISILSSNGGDILDYIGVDQVQLPGAPLICIPTTAGTGAEISQFAIITDSNEQVKKAIISKKVVPDLALIDPIPLMTMSKSLLAETGLDALTHAIEAYVSTASGEISDLHALKAITLINENITNAYQSKKIEYLNALMFASAHAGIAFSNASLGGVHAMAHSLGGVLDLPHGFCNSVLLSHIIGVNFDTVPDKFIKIAKRMNLNLQIYDVSEWKEVLIKHILHLSDDLGIPTKIHVPQLNNQILDKLAESAIQDPCIITNPKPLSKEEVRGIYDKILQKK